MSHVQDDRDKAFQAFLIALLPKLAIRAQYKLHDRHLAEDAAQEAARRTMIQYRADRLVRVNKVDHELWVLGILNKICLEWIRRRKSDKNYLQKQFDLLPRSGEATTCPEEMVEYERIADALSSLCLRDREVVVLHIYEYMTFKQIATQLGIPESTAAGRFYSALEKLKPLLKNCLTR